MNRSFVIAILTTLCALLIPSCGGQLERKKEFGLLDVTVVCDGCSPEFLEAKSVGIQTALRMLYTEIGDINPRRGEITVHLDMDELCTFALQDLRRAGGRPEMSAFALCVNVNDVPNVCEICFLKIPEQDIETASSLAGQVLPIHEIGHVWWKTRLAYNYSAEEPLVQLLSYALSGDTTYCTRYKWNSPPLSLVGDLCDLKISRSQVIRIYRSSAELSKKLARPITEEELAQVVSTVMGQDMRPSFVRAGIIKKSGS